ncbi:MAG TPA: SpoIIE family protein phosphatase [Solirubrobacter sp.]|nr:SpoIIE family protein phosphatase [Solirubrobacter sp.]
MTDLDDPRRIEAARRLLAEAPGEALDRLAALSARLLGTAHAQIAVRTDELVTITPLGGPRADELVERTLAKGAPLAVAEPAFLGVPIEAAGALVGVLCVHDPEPYEWTEHDVEVLRELAATVAVELERGALAAELETSTVRLDLGFAAAEIGSFDWDLVTNALHWDDRLMELFGYTRDAFPQDIEAFRARVHPDDRSRVEAAIAQAVERCGEYEAEYRVVHPDGTVRWVAARGRVLCDPEGKPARMIGAAYDTTDVHSAAERLGRVLETMSTAFITLDHDWVFTYVNAAAERIFGRRRDELVGQRIPDLYPELRGALTGDSFQHYYEPLDAWFDVRVTRTEDGLSIYFHEITDRVRAEREREEATGRLMILSAAGARLAGTLEVDELLQILSDVVLNGFGEGVVITLDDRVVHTAGVEDDGRPSLALPLISRGRQLGTMVVLDPVSGELDRSVLVELAARAAVALDNALLYDVERRLALTLQRTLLPLGLPEVPGVELAARYLPGAGGRDVGGDFYIGHALDDGRLVLVIGDVMGHGAQAAARMGQLRAVLAAYAYDGDPPDQVLAHLSERSQALLDVPMATVLAAVYDPARRELTFALAGHLPPLVAPPDGPPSFVAVRPGPPLGVGAAAYERHVVAIPPGATVVLYTDGLIERRGRDIDEGLEQLRRALVDVRLSPEAVCSHVLGVLERVQGGKDDIALLVMRHAA